MPVTFLKPPFHATAGSHLLLQMITYPQSESTSVEDNNNDDESEEVDRVALFDGESGVIIDQAPTDVKTQLLEPDEWLVRKSR